MNPGPLTAPSPEFDRKWLGRPGGFDYKPGMRWLIPPLRDYSGRFSPLKTVVFFGLFVPAGFTAYWYATDALGARPLTEALHEIGDWTIRFIFLALAISPLSQLWQWPRLQLVRRMIGVMAFAYVAAHLTLYTTDEMFNLAKVAGEIVKRIYLTIGFTAWLGLAALAVTSTDGMVRQMGARNWQRLHQFVYVIGILAVTHYFMQSKLNEWQPTMMAGLLVWLLGYRGLRRLYGRSRKVGPVACRAVEPGRGLRHHLRRNHVFLAGFSRVAAAHHPGRILHHDRHPPGLGGARPGRGGDADRRGARVPGQSGQESPASPGRVTRSGRCLGLIVDLDQSTSTRCAIKRLADDKSAVIALDPVWP